jgi:hypothetical protein
MPLLWQSTVTKHPYYQPPDVVFANPIEDDDDLFLAAWYMFLSHVYKQENK